MVLTLRDHSRLAYLSDKPKRKKKRKALEKEKRKALENQKEKHMGNSSLYNGDKEAEESEALGEPTNEGVDENTVFSAEVLATIRKDKGTSNSAVEIALLKQNLLFIETFHIELRELKTEVHNIRKELAELIS